MDEAAVNRAYIILTMYAGTKDPAPGIAERFAGWLADFTREKEEALRMFFDSFLGGDNRAADNRGNELFSTIEQARKKA